MRIIGWWQKSKKGADLIARNNFLGFRNGNGSAYSQLLGMGMKTIWNWNGNNKFGDTNSHSPCLVVTNENIHPFSYYEARYILQPLFKCVFICCLQMVYVLCVSWMRFSYMCFLATCTYMCVLLMFMCVSQMCVYLLLANDLCPVSFLPLAQFPSPKGW